MSKKEILKNEDLENIHGGTRPEEIGEPRLLIQGIWSYEICEKCGAAMFPVKVRHAGGTMILPSHPDYKCSECDNRHITIKVF